MVENRLFAEAVEACQGARSLNRTPLALMPEAPAAGFRNVRLEGAPDIFGMGESIPRPA